ncbi:MAG: hypothetical protein ACXWC9_08950, partial [Pseudobdellovibrionaceae bacterium]
RRPCGAGAPLARDEHVERFPRNCGYNLQVKASIIDKMIDEIKPPDLTPKCGESMCTSATYLAFTSLLHQLKNSGKISRERFEELIGRDKMPWKYLNELARPDRLVTDLNLGEGRVIAPDQIKDCSIKNWPKQGDFVQFWRKTGSGHSVIFEGYLYDESKKITGFCYWSSNASTKGFAKRCEKTNILTKMMAGRITK